ncbi:MAG: ABC transporter permease subunit [Ruthenibacterium sp.]
MEKLLKTKIKNKDNSLQLKFRASRDIPIYLLLLPALGLVAVFCYGPMYGLLMAFQDFSPFKNIWGSTWVGLENFKFFLSDPNFWRVLKNTLVINIFQLVFGFPFPVIFAILLNELVFTRFKKVVQTLSYLPYFISWVVAASIISTFLDPSTGMLNLFLKNVFGMEPVYWLTKESAFVPIIVISSIWKGFGMSSVYYLAAITGIDQSLFEAAKIDGANRMQQIWHIMVPALKPIVTVLLVLQVGQIMSIGFEQIYLLYNPMVYSVGDVLSTYTYRMGVLQTQYSLTTAIGISQSFVNFILVLAANKISKKLAGWSMW